MEIILWFIVCMVLGCIVAAGLPLVSTGIVAAFTAHPIIFFATVATVMTGVFCGLLVLLIAHISR